MSRDFQHGTFQRGLEGSLSTHLPRSFNGEKRFRPVFNSIWRCFSIQFHNVVHMFFTFYSYVFLAFHCTVLLFADLPSTLCRHENPLEPCSTYGKSQLSFQAFTIFLVSVLARPWKGPNCWGICVQSLKSAGHSGKFAFKNSWQSVCEPSHWRKAGKSLLPAVCFPSLYSAISSWGVAWCCSAPAWQHQTPRKRP